MSDERPIVPNKPRDDSRDPTPADYFTLQIAADNSCAIKFFANGVEIGWFYMSADLADVLAANIEPERRKEKFEEVRDGFHKARH